VVGRYVAVGTPPTPPDPDQSLALSLETVGVFGSERIAVKPEARAHVLSRLKYWGIDKSIDQPGISFGYGTVVGPKPPLGTATFQDWANKQSKSGRAILLRGNPYLNTPQAELYVYATRYEDFAFAGPAEPYILVPPGPPGWRDSAVPDPRDDPSGVGGSAAASKYAGAVVLAMVALGLGWALIRPHTKRSEG
jgi:hypothetical protein